MDTIAQSLVDAVTGALGAALGAVWSIWWIPWVVWGAAGLATLFVLNLLKNVFGNVGVVAGLLVIASAVSGVFGFRKGAAWANRRLTDRARDQAPAPTRRRPTILPPWGRR